MGKLKPIPVPLTALRAIPAGSFQMGSDVHYPEERPQRRVSVSAFQIEETTVTNAQFAFFVAQTGYLTVAECQPDPRAYPGADPKNLVPGGMVFRMTQGPVDLGDYRNWWVWTPGACWHRPEGRPSSYQIGRAHV